MRMKLLGVLVCVGSVASSGVVIGLPTSPRRDSGSSLTDMLVQELKQKNEALMVENAALKKKFVDSPRVQIYRKIVDAMCQAPQKKLAAAVMRKAYRELLTVTMREVASFSCKSTDEKCIDNCFRILGEEWYQNLRYQFLPIEG